MKRESAIITNFLIERPKQIKLFQLKIPREAENIIGIEMGLTWLNGILPAIVPPLEWTLPMTMNRNIVLGEVKLQSYEKANVFYTQELVLNQNLAPADFTSKYFVPKAYTHQNQSNEDQVQVSGTTTILQGVYKDALAEQIVGSYRYIVRVYVWHDRKTETQILKP